MQTQKERPPPKLPKFFKPEEEEKRQFNAEFQRLWAEKNCPATAGSDPDYGWCNVNRPRTASPNRRSSAPTDAEAATDAHSLVAIKDEERQSDDQTPIASKEKALIPHRGKTGHTAEAIKGAAVNTLAPIPPHIKKPYITRKTIELMEIRQQARDQGNWTEEKGLNKKS